MLLMIDTPVPEIAVAVPEPAEADAALTKDQQEQAFVEHAIRVATLINNCNTATSAGFAACHGYNSGNITEIEKA